MNAFILVFSFLKSQTTEIVFDKIKNNQQLYELTKDKILKQIENREYIRFNYLEQYNKITLSFDEGRKFFFLEIEKKNLSDADQNTEKLPYYYGNKSANEIREDIECHLALRLKSEISLSFILVYDSSNFASSSIMKDVVESIKNINEKRRMNIKAWEIYYEHICEDDSYLNGMLNALKPATIDNEDKLLMSMVHVWENGNHQDRNLRFYIKREDMCYLFEINVEELGVGNFYTLSDTNIILNNNFDTCILQKLLKICELFHFQLIETYYLPHHLKITSNEIEIPKSNFKLEMLPDKISFNHNNGKYFYYPKANTAEKDNNLFIEEKFYIKFREILNKISEIKNVEYDCRGIELFFRMFRSHNKIESIMAKIIKNKKSPLNIICAHLLVSGNIINQHHFRAILGIGEGLDYDTFIPDIINILMFKAAEAGHAYCYLIKICLLIEAERFINESHHKNDELVSTLKDIQTFIIEKTDTKKDNNDHNRACISLGQIMQEIVNTHIENIYNFKSSIILHFCKIGLLFTGLDDFFGHKYDQIKNNKDGFIQDLGFDKVQIYETTKIIQKRLAENTVMDIKFKETRIRKIEEMKPMENILVTLLSENLKNIILEGHNRDLNNNFDERGRIMFENELITKANKDIEETFNENEDEIITTNINKELVLEYKNDSKKHIKKIITMSVLENFKKKAMEELPKTIIKLFGSNFITNPYEKEKSETELEFIKLLLCKLELLQIIQEAPGIELFDKLVSIFKNY
ncbi:uncharacterized protein VNE69_06108 [Vairimorpha necatrix]|uniref:Uncharacterized protein n=1 Tax=Vairimorpha necatrix TaxID=6039 RepID=A0AAX4JD38_9MICR